MKVISFLICLLTIGICSLQAQTDKIRIAVFDPHYSGNLVDEGTAIATREIVSSVFVNSPKYNIVERSLLDKILKEQKFSNSGAVDASQVSELGKLVGASKAVLIVLTSAGKKALLSIKMVDVESANVEDQKVKTISPNELLDVIEPLTLNLIGETATTASVDMSKIGNESTSFADRIKGIGKRNDSQKEEEKNKKNNFIEHNEETVFFDSPTYQEKEVLLEFKGENSSKNPTVEIFMDGKKIGDGTLNQGFRIKFKDINQGVHTLKMEWSGVVPSSSFKINTNVDNYYEFEYKKTGFGYVFKLKK